MRVPDLSDMAEPGRNLAVRVTPKASRDGIAVQPDGALKVHVTAPPENGRANRAAARVLARALGVAKTRVSLVRGERARDKVFRVD